MELFLSPCLPNSSDQWGFPVPGNCSCLDIQHPCHPAQPSCFALPLVPGWPLKKHLRSSKVTQRRQASLLPFHRGHRGGKVILEAISAAFLCCMHYVPCHHLLALKKLDAKSQETFLTFIHEKKATNSNFSFLFFWHLRSDTFFLGKMTS